MPLTDQQVMAAIERICGDDFCEELDMRDASEGFELTGDLKTAYEKLSAVYRLSHSALTSNTCYSAHKDWREEAERLVAEMEKESK